MLHFDPRSMGMWDVERVHLIQYFQFFDSYLWWQNQTQKYIFKQNTRIPARFCQESNLEEKSSIRNNADHHCNLGFGHTEMSQLWGLDAEGCPWVKQPVSSQDHPSRPRNCNSVLISKGWLTKRSGPVSWRCWLQQILTAPCIWPSE